MDRSPNILLILLDSALQHRYGCYGGPVRTPHADRLAAEGMRFTRAYSPAPICHPARSVIDTGLYPHANGMITNRCGRGAYPFKVWDHIPSLASYFQQAGYRTGYAGQGHIDVRGFEDDRCYPTSEFRAWLGEQGREERARPDRKYRGCGTLDGTPEHARDAGFARRAIHLIDEYAALEDRPWLIQLDFDGPHPPCLVPEPWDTMYDPAAVELPPSLRDGLEDVPPAVRHARNAQGGQEWSDDDWRRYIAHFYGMTTFMDHLVGTVLERLEARGLAENTVVVLTSDHGGLMGAHGFLMHGSPALYDPALRVPLLFRWPGRIAAGSRCDSFFGHADLLPTLLELAGIHSAGEREDRLHGRSLAPLLLGRQAEGVPDDVYGQYHGDGVQFYSARWVRTAEWTYTFAPHGGEELYHFASDPDERRNRASDPSARNGLEEMRRRLGGWMERVDDPLRFTSIWRSVRAES